MRYGGGGIINHVTQKVKSACVLTIIKKNISVWNCLRNDKYKFSIQNKTINFFLTIGAKLLKMNAPTPIQLGRRINPIWLGIMFACTTQARFNLNIKAVQMLVKCFFRSQALCFGGYSTVIGSFRSFGWNDNKAARSGLQLRNTIVNCKRFFSLHYGRIYGETKQFKMVHQ